MAQNGKAPFSAKAWEGGEEARKSFLVRGQRSGRDGLGVGVGRIGVGLL